jgi:site-specific DNA recombinase
MKAIAYVRKSTDSQDYEYQINLVNERCKKDNLDLIETFSETGSGLKNSRKELARMKKYIEDSTDLDFVVVSELSRLGRNYKTHEIIELLTSKKIGLISIKEGIVTKSDDPQREQINSFILGIINQINGFELQTLKFRTKYGHKQNRIEGRAGGGVLIAYGYKKIGTAKNSKLVINEDEVPLVQLIFEKYLNLKENSVSSIVKYLNDNNIKTRSELINPDTKKKWSNATIYSVLRNKMYIGKRLYKDEYVDAPQLRILDDETFNKVEEKLKSCINKSNHNTVYNYILENRKISCGVCGQHFYATKSKSDSRYICHSNRTEKCKNCGISIDKMERLVQLVILERYSDILKENLESKVNKEEIENLNVEIEKLEKELSREVKKEINLIDFLQDELMTKEQYKEKRQEYQQKQIQIQTKIDNIKKDIESRNLEFEDIVNIGKLERDFNTKNIHLPKNVVNTIISNIKVTKIENTLNELQKLSFKVFSILQTANPEIDVPSKFRKNDKIMLITIKSGVYKLLFLIPQHSEYVFDLQDNKIKTIATSKRNIGFSNWSLNVPEAVQSKNLQRWLKLV